MRDPARRSLSTKAVDLLIGRLEDATADGLLHFDAPTYALLLHCLFPEQFDAQPAPGPLPGRAGSAERLAELARRVAAEAELFDPDDSPVLGRPSRPPADGVPRGRYSGHFNLDADE